MIGSGKYIVNKTNVKEISYLFLHIKYSIIKDYFLKRIV